MSSRLGYRLYVSTAFHLHHIRPQMSSNTLVIVCVTLLACSKQSKMSCTELWVSVSSKGINNASTSDADEIRNTPVQKLGTLPLKLCLKHC